MLVNAGAGLPIVVVQFAKIKIFAGYKFVFGLFLVSFLGCFLYSCFGC
jgi:hypothetical protein